MVWYIIANISAVVHCIGLLKVNIYASGILDRTETLTH